ncbi:MAG TPA: hypothetical protein PKA34_29315 [Blastocatellia bacterium]|nr:hypothetical protein [Blastocatellia bacterium]HNG31805.1 hypothetical protein [Blastocatellia bacterium]
MKKWLFALTLTSVVLVSCKSLSSQTGNLSIEAAIVYAVGGPQPVAREEIRLLKKDGLEVHFNGAYNTGAIDDRLTNYFLARYYADSEAKQKRDSPEQVYLDLVKEAGRVEQELKDSTAFITTTDFAGKAEFKDLPVGKTFYVYAVAPTRGGHCLWNLKTEIKPGANHLILDQKNAAFAR